MANQEFTKLEKLLGKNKGVLDKNRAVVYGKYDNRSGGLFDRLNDWLIDSSKVSLQEKAYFFHMLAVMIDAGVPLMNAMEILSSKAESVRLARILYTISYDLKQGAQLSKSMSKFPDVFGDMELGIVKAGEAAGNMDKMLFKLAEEIDKAHELQIKLVTASIYPMAVLVILVLAASGMLIFVIPELVKLLTEGGLKPEDFPLMTKVLLAISDLVTNYWWIAISVVATVYFAFQFWAATEDGKFRKDYFLLKLPIVGELLVKVYVLRFVSNLGILLESGLPVIQSLEIVASAMSNKLYELKTWEVIHRVKDGAKISESLADSPFLFSSTVTQMLGVAEKTASMSKIANKISEQYSREIDHSLKRLTALFEPLMIVFVGVTVALLALAILSPIFQLTSLVQS